LKEVRLLFIGGWGAWPFTIGRIGPAIDPKKKREFRDALASGFDYWKYIDRGFGMRWNCFYAFLIYFLK